MNTIELLVHGGGGCYWTQQRKDRWFVYWFDNHGKHAAGDPAGYVTRDSARSAAARYATY